MREVIGFVLWGFKQRFQPRNPKLAFSRILQFGKSDA